MPTETPTLPPQAALGDTAHTEHAAELHPPAMTGTVEHEFTFADPHSRFAQEFGAAYQESWAQVRSQSSTTAERAGSENPSQEAPTEALDIADIRAHVHELATSAEHGETAVTGRADTVEIPSVVPGTIANEPVRTANQLPTQMSVPQAGTGRMKQRLSSTRERAANLVFTYMGSKTPKIIKNHVPVYRAVNKNNAGYGNQWGVSEWTIGAGVEPKQHAMEWVKNHTYDPSNSDTHHLRDADEFVAIKSTLGELEKNGKAEVRHYGEYGSSRKKVVVRHAAPSQPIRHKVIASNKHLA
jgi:hypothetical protein